MLRRGDSPTGLCSQLGLCPLLRRLKKALCICVCCLGAVCDRRDPGAGWRLFVKRSEIPKWKELMKYGIITQSCQH